MSEKIVACLLLIISGIIYWQTSIIPEPTMYTVVGPGVIPHYLAWGMLILSTIYAIKAFFFKSSNTQEPEEPPESGYQKRLQLFLGSGVALILLLPVIGFLIPATLAGVGVALAFDAPKSNKTYLICGSIALVFWSIFSLGLGVDLGHLFDFDISFLKGAEE